MVNDVMPLFANSGLPNRDDLIQQGTGFNEWAVRHALERTFTGVSAGSQRRYRRRSYQRDINSMAMQEAIAIC